MAIERGERFAEAGGDCLFVPGVIDPERDRATGRSAARCR